MKIRCGHRISQKDGFGRTRFGVVRSQNNDKPVILVSWDGDPLVVGCLKGTVKRA